MNGTVTLQTERLTLRKVSMDDVQVLHRELGCNPEIGTSSDQKVYEIRRGKKYFFPGCRIKARYPAGSERLAEYMLKKHGLQAEGCCKENYQKLNPEDTVVLICNNCAAELDKLMPDRKTEFVYELIDRDPEFIFPDYRGKKMILQDCSHGYHGHEIAKTVRSVLDKMNIRYDALEDGYISGSHAEVIRKNVERIESAPALNEREIVTYCGICNLGYLQRGKKSNYLMDLLFGVEN